MLELLKIIILTCQVSSGSVVPAVVDRHQKACQKDMLKCVQPIGNGIDTTKSLIKCLEER